MYLYKGNLYHVLDKAVSCCRAAEMMTQTSNRVTLKVAKQGAIYHGLATVLSQQSPIMQRGKSTLYHCNIHVHNTIDLTN